MSGPMAVEGGAGDRLVQITDVRVKLAENQQERLLAFCTLTIDHGFVIRDVKVIEGLKGPFVAMPSRKVMGRCHGCGDKNHLKAKHCNNCGDALEPVGVMDDGRGRPRLYVDIAHPINQRCRATIETACIQAYQAELEASKQPGYVPQDLDDFEDVRPRRQHSDDGQHEGEQEGEREANAG